MQRISSDVKLVVDELEDDGYSSRATSIRQSHGRDELKDVVSLSNMFRQRSSTCVPYDTFSDVPAEGNAARRATRFGFHLSSLFPKRLRHNLPPLTDEAFEQEVMQLDDLISKLEDLSEALKLQMSQMKKDLLPDLQENQPIPYFIRFLLPVVCCIQIIWVVLLILTDNFLKQSVVAKIIVEILMVLLHLINGVHVGLATAALTRQLLKFKYASGYLMAQTYLSTVLLFAGIYVIIFRFSPSSWGLPDPQDVGIEMTYVRMLYLSVSSATLCGSSNVDPLAWYAIIIVCIQSLINFVYFASILAQTIGNYAVSAPAVIQRRERLESIRTAIRASVSMPSYRRSSS